MFKKKRRKETVVSLILSFLRMQRFCTANNLFTFQGYLPLSVTFQEKSFFLPPFII